MATYALVRHARAGVRGTWPGDDLDRPLDDRGRAQSRGMVPALAPLATALRTSRAVRCHDTLLPLAATTGLEVVAAPELLEGADPAAALAWLLAQPDGTVACSHGDVIGGIGRLLVGAGVLDEATAAWPKGGWWRIGATGGVVDSVLVHRPREA